MWLISIVFVVVLTPLAHLAYKRNAENGKNESQMHIGCCQSNAKRNAKCFGTQKVEPSGQKFLICRMENFNRNVPALRETKSNFSNWYIKHSIRIAPPHALLSAALQLYLLHLSLSLSFYMHVCVCVILRKHFDCHMPIACWNACRNLSWKLLPLTVTNANVKVCPSQKPAHPDVDTCRQLFSF